MRFVCPSQVLFRCVLLLLGMSLALSGSAAEPGPVIPKGKGDQCVADTDFMRRNHMDLIVHQRDDTVIRGIRDEPFSLVECVDCHAQKNANNEPVRIDAEGQFCDSCHAYAAVKIDCFGCHAAVPDSDKSKRVGSNQWLPHKQLLAFKPALPPAHDSSLPMQLDPNPNLQLNTVLERDRNELISTKPE